MFGSAILRHRGSANECDSWIEYGLVCILRILANGAFWCFVVSDDVRSLGRRFVVVASFVSDSCAFAKSCEVTKPGTLLDVLFAKTTTSLPSSF